MASPTPKNSNRNRNGIANVSGAGVESKKSISVLPSKKDEAKGQEMVKELENDLIQQNHHQRNLLKQTDPKVYDASKEKPEPPESTHTL